MAPGATVAETYARDAMAAPLRELLRVLAAVRANTFCPDATRSGMFVNIALKPSHAQGIDDSDADDSDSDAECFLESDSEPEDREAEDLPDSLPLLRLLPAAARPRLLSAAAGGKVFRRNYSGMGLLRDFCDLQPLSVAR